MGLEESHLERTLLSGALAEGLEHVYICREGLLQRLLGWALLLRAEHLERGRRLGVLLVSLLSLFLKGTHSSQR